MVTPNTRSSKCAVASSKAAAEKDKKEHNADITNITNITNSNESSISHNNDSSHSSIESSSSSSSSSDSSNSNSSSSSSNSSRGLARVDDEQHADNKKCESSKTCVSGCAAYGRVCPRAARAAGKAAKETIADLMLDSKIFVSLPKLKRFHQDEIRLGEKLGEGGYCFVHSCTVEHHQQASNHQKSNKFKEEDDGTNSTDSSSSGVSSSTPSSSFAIKFLKRKVMANPRTFRCGSADLATEAMFLGSLQHPNIVTLHGVTAGCVERNFGSCRDRGYFIIIDRLVETLNDRIKNTWRPQHDAQHKSSVRNYFSQFSKEYREKHQRMLLERLQVAEQVVEAMKYIHIMNIAYRDLKPDNIGFTENGTVKIFDFGLAKEEKASEANGFGKYNMTGCTGSRRYMAPEVAKGDAYNKMVDVYSFGILLWELCSLQKPFEGYTSTKHMNQVVLGGERPKLDSHSCELQWPIELQFLIKQCWDSFSDARPTFAEVQDTLESIIGELETALAESTTNTSNNSTTIMKSVLRRIPKGGTTSVRAMSPKPYIKNNDSSGDREQQRHQRNESLSSSPCSSSSTHSNGASTGILRRPLSPKKWMLRLSPRCER